MAYAKAAAAIAQSLGELPFIDFSLRWRVGIENKLVLAISETICLSGNPSITFVVLAE